MLFLDRKFRLNPEPGCFQVLLAISNEENAWAAGNISIYAIKRSTKLAKRPVPFQIKLARLVVQIR